MDATDFVPSEAEIEVNKAYYQDDVKNLADIDEVGEESKKGELRADIISQIKQSTSEYENRFLSQQNAYITENDGLWNQMDANFRCGINDASIQSQKRTGANLPEKWSRSKTASTTFFRQTTQKAANLYAVLTSKDMPFRYDALHDESESSDDAKSRAKELNLLAKWSMKADGFNIKSLEFATQVNKYGNIPVMVEWIQRIGQKKIRVPVFKEDGITIDRYNIGEYQGVIENRPTSSLLAIESLKADITIGNIQGQECVIVSSVVGMSSVVDGIRTGLYRSDLLADVDSSQQWDGFSGFENEEEKNQNRDLNDQPTRTGSGQYLKREIFINVPIDEEEETWDDLKNIPERYRVTMFGNTPHEAVIARIERNQEPDDTIPIEMVHANPDDSDFLYHISGYEVIRSNMSIETTIKRQMIDNNTLVNMPPSWEVKGAVDGNERTFGPDLRLKVDDKDSFGFLNVRDISQSNMLLLEHTKDDSNTANSIDKNMIGESQGARTSSAEAQDISNNSRRPNLVNIEYILQQYLGFYAQRLKVNWEAYGRKDQVIQITDENDKTVFIRPTDITGEYDVIIDVVDDIKEDAVQANRLNNYMTTVGAIPQLAQRQDWDDLAREYAEMAMGTSKFVIEGNEGDAVANAQNNVLRMLNNGEQPEFDPSMNLKKHLEIYKAQRIQLNGHEEQYPNVVILDRVIQLLQEQVNNPQPQASAPQAAPTAGQEQAGALGGVQ